MVSTFGRRGGGGRVHFFQVSKIWAMSELIHSKIIDVYTIEQDNALSLSGLSKTACCICYFRSFLIFKVLIKINAFESYKYLFPDCYYLGRLTANLNVLFHF